MLNQFQTLKMPCPRGRWIGGEGLALEMPVLAKTGPRECQQSGSQVMPGGSPLLRVPVHHRAASHATTLHQYLPSKPRSGGPCNNACTKGSRPTSRRRQYPKQSPNGQ